MTNENERKESAATGPGEARADGHAAHGYRNEVSWDGGKGRQPYANQGAEEQSPGSAHEYEAGNAGEAAGRNIEQLEEVKRKPGRTESEVPRATGRDEPAQ